MANRLGTLGGVLLLVSAVAARGEDPVLVNITGPLVGKVGQRVTFEVELVNRSQRNLEKLRVIDYFDSGFHHEASKSPIEQKGTVDLAVGTSRRVTIEFLLDEPGRQCHRVEILDQSHAIVGTAMECVQVAAAAAAGTPAPAATPAATTPPPLVVPPLAATSGSLALQPPTAPAAPALALDLAGPVEATSGGVTEYVARIRNTGNAPSAPSVLQFHWDAALVPQEASDGFSLADSRVSWNLPVIEPGGELKRQINLRAQVPATAYSDGPPTRTCIRAELTGLAGGAVLADQECLQIKSTTPRPKLRTPSEAGLRLSLADLDDPVVTGDATTLVCTVFNDGAAASGPLSLTIDLPRNAQLVGDARIRAEDGRLFFDAVDIPAGRHQSFEISYRLRDAGRARASATVTGAGLEGRLDRGCETEFVAP
jgi:hypothetical protein